MEEQSTENININPQLKCKGPMLTELEAGQRISWCTCGYSSKEPLCDGSHREAPTELRSFKYEPEVSGKVMLCGCKHTKNPPFCDGSHSKF